MVAPAPATGAHRGRTGSAPGTGGHPEPEGSGTAEPLRARGAPCTPATPAATPAPSPGTELRPLQACALPPCAAARPGRVGAGRSCPPRPAPRQGGCTAGPPPIGRDPRLRPHPPPEPSKGAGKGRGLWGQMDGRVLWGGPHRHPSAPPRSPLASPIPTPLGKSWGEGDAARA